MAKKLVLQSEAKEMDKDSDDLSDDAEIETVKSGKNHPKKKFDGRLQFGSIQLELKGKNDVHGQEWISCALTTTKIGD